MESENTPLESPVSPSAIPNPRSSGAAAAGMRPRAGRRLHGWLALAILLAAFWVRRDAARIGLP